MSTQQRVRVAVAGARGRTGSIVADALRASDGMTIVGTLVRAGKQTYDGEFDSVAELARTAKPDVLVDFTVFPDSKAIALSAIQHGIRPVIGTSGYARNDLDDIREAARRAKIGAVYAANFSIGATLMMQFARLAAPFFTHAEIVETHHTGKKDAPSGTAVATANLIAHAAHLQRASSEHIHAEGARGATVNGVGIHSLRLPNAVGTHEIRFANDGEVLTITHATNNRAAFVAGVIQAVRGVGALDTLVEGLEGLST